MDIKCDNFEEIKKHLKFENENEFYFVQLIQRKKDGCSIESGNNGYHTIKSYYIKSLDEWNRRVPKIKELCEDNNARAYININRRNTMDCCWEAVEKYMELIRNNHTHQGYKVWDHACGVSKSVDKMWMVDVDSKDILEKVKMLINECKGANDNHIKFIIPTIQGYHIITEGFDISNFNQRCLIENLPEIEVHKEGNILLYYNK